MSLLWGTKDAKVGGESARIIVMNHRFGKAGPQPVLGFTIGLCGILVSGWSERALGAERQVLSGHRPPGAVTLAPVGRLPETQRLDLAIALPLRDKGGLTSLLRQLYDPASPDYRHFLTSAEFTARFGPTEADYEAVKAFAVSNGLTVKATHSNRVVLDVSGAVPDIERAFQVTLRTYRHPQESREFYAPNAEPSLELSVPVMSVAGLDNYMTPRPLLHATPWANSVNPRPQAGSASGGLYIGNDFRAAYVPGVLLKGAGQAVGLFELDGYYANDITLYESDASLPNVTLTNVLVDGATGGAGSGNTEVALDIEMALSMAPQLSRIIVYEGPSSGTTLANIFDVLNRMATDNLAKQLSCSWAWTAATNATTDQIFLQYAAQGQSFFQASGDSGAYTGTVMQPGDNPNITIVGGTILATTGGGGAYVSETAWSGSGGGISPSYAIPSWQQSVSMSLNQGSTSLRNFPDVSIVSTNLYLRAGNGLTYISWGTSAAAPLWAGFVALVNQQAATNGLSPVGFINPALYTIAQGSGYSLCFHDITTGNNFNSSSPTKFPAVTGYDLCTGWGSPNGAALINALAGSPQPALASNSVVLLAESCPNGAVDPGETVTVSLGLKNAGSANTTNLVATLQATGGVTSPSAAQTYGIVVAGGSGVSQPFTFTATGACGGTITVTLQLQDGAANLGSVSFALPLGNLVASTPLTQNFDGVTAPALPAGWTTTASGGQSAWVTSTATNDTAPNAAFSAEAATAGLNELVSPTVAIVSSSAQLTFRHNYNMQTRNSSTAYDGGVLEIQLGSGAFTDILTAGGSFVSGGYNRTISSSHSNPLAGRKAWSGNSSGFVTTTVTLPAAAAGQSIRLKWRCGTDSSISSSGWYVDSVSLQDSAYACCTPSADLLITQTASPTPSVAAHYLTYSFSVTNLGPAPAVATVVTDSLPAGVSFVSASAGATNAGSSVIFSLGTLASGSATNLSVTVLPSTGGTLTNIVAVSSSTPDPNPANNFVTNLDTVNVSPAISSPPTNQVVTVGASAGFTVSASGTAPLGYQWLFDGTNLAGATTASLTLTNIQAWQAGSYLVAVSNVAGSATSVVASLRVLVSPQLGRLQIGTTGATVAFGSVTGLIYTLEYKTSLLQTAWTALPPPVAATGLTLSLSDTNVPLGNRFYRIRCE